MRRPKDYIIIFVKGLCMGATQVLNGVSASTIAIILGVYQEFHQSINTIDRKAFNLLKEREFASLWKKINGNFIGLILAGLIAGMLSLAKLLAYLNQYHFIISLSFLFGLILISSLLVLRKIKKWTIGVIIALLAGGAISYTLTIIHPLVTPHNYLFVFIAGVLAGCSLALPGISSAFILLIIGKYQFIVASFSQLNVGVITVFVIGSLTGLWAASRFIAKIVADYNSTTVALLAGLMIGSLNKIWPWRNVFEFVTNSKGIQLPAFDESILPWKYMTITGKDPQVFQAIFMMALGVLMVVLIEKIAAGLKTKL